MIKRIIKHLYLKGNSRCCDTTVHTHCEYKETLCNGDAPFTVHEQCTLFNNVEKRTNVPLKICDNNYGKYYEGEA